MARYVQREKIAEFLDNVFGIDGKIIRSFSVDPDEVHIEVLVKQSDGTPLLDSEFEPVTTWVSYPVRTKDEHAQDLRDEKES